MKYSELIKMYLTNKILSSKDKQQQIKREKVTKKTIIKSRKSNKNKWIAAILAYFTGWVGGHKFYLNMPSAKWYAIFFWTGIPACIAIFEMLYYIFISHDTFDEKYNYSNYGWLNGEIEEIYTPTEIEIEENEFTMQKYSKLKAFTYDMQNLINKLQNDKDIIQEFNNNPQELQAAIHYDMVNMFVAIYGNDANNYSIEHFAMFLLLPTNIGNILLDMDYRKLANKHKNKEMATAITNYITMILNQEKPLSLYSEDNLLCFPAFLKSKNNPNFNFYADTLLNYVNLLTIMSDYTEPTKTTKINELSRLLYSPNIK